MDWNWEEYHCTGTALRIANSTLQCHNVLEDTRLYRNSDVEGKEVSTGKQTTIEDHLADGRYAQALLRYWIYTVYLPNITVGRKKISDIEK